MSRITLHFLLAAALVLVAALAVGGVTPAAAKATLIVDDNGAECPNAAFTTIGDAVAAAASGDVIEVCYGTYTEQVIIDGFAKLTVRGIPEPVTGNLPVVQPAPGAKGAIIRVTNSPKVGIFGLEINGAGNFTDGTCHADRFDQNAGIFFRNSGGVIEGNRVLGIHHTPFNGCQEGLGIWVRDDNDDGTTSRVKIRDNEVEDYQKGGIVIQWAVKFQVRGNAVTGVAPTASIAQNGIQASYGAFGKIRDNVVDGNWYTGASWTSSGILVFETDNVKVMNNEVYDSQSGIVVETWCWAYPSANNNKIKGNLVSESEWGITVDAGEFNGYSTCDPTANNNKVTNNDVVNSTVTGDTGIYIGAWQDYGGDAGFTAEADSNKITGNTIGGFTNPTVDEGTNNLFSDNTILP